MKIKTSLFTAFYIAMLISIASPAWAQDVDVGGNVDKEDPTVSITNPINGATVSETVNITADASDDAGVAKVEFLIDSVLKATDTTSPYSFFWDSTSVNNGSHQISAKVYDVAGKTATDTILVLVDNAILQSPTKKIKEPKITPGSPTETGSPSSERKTTLVDLPGDGKETKPFFIDQKDFLLGVIVGFEIFLVILLIYLIKHRKGPSRQNLP